jgi:hypothetical protein
MTKVMVAPQKPSLTNLPAPIFFQVIDDEIQCGWSGFFGGYHAGI